MDKSDQHADGPQEVQRSMVEADSPVSEENEALALVSHELRSLITIVTGTATVLLQSRDRLDKEEVDGGLREIEAAGERMDRIVSNLLTLGRVQRGEEIELEPMIVARLVGKLISEHQRRYPEREIRLLEKGDPSPVLGNEFYVEQTVENLLSNAEKYSPRDSPIDVSVVRSPSQVVVTVRDHGPGIPPEEQELIFEPFYRARAARALRSASGVGVGLTVCKKLVEAHGGQLSVRNHEEGGVEFSITLPIVTADD